MVNKGETMKSKQLQKCQDCQNSVSKIAVTCPHCGRHMRNLRTEDTTNVVLFIIIPMILGFFVLSGCNELADWLSR